ncbi:DEAD/DEAH box helicase [archaeon]|jgi:SNF2 family DNA or RNA helicase|nr:DEAD/DEAH box helicase [archaeon]MBT6606385.1 DEAD/DEAH box helicase [archaeon]MBT7251446.1 DEAD/DEAH box helicase [archaeon]MBT7661232.1 DEAD/DEAH box helicase [archaeon]
MVEIVVNDNFNEAGEANLFEDIGNGKFESSDLFKLRMDVDELVEDSEINELLSYGSFSKNLAYDLPYQRSGAIKLLRDFNMSALLADEVGLGKTITTGMAIKEGIYRGFLKKIVILTPPSLVDQWVIELRDKFGLEFNIIESAEDWNKFDFAIASIDRVKIFDKVTRGFRHKSAHSVLWDLVIVDEAHKLKEKNTVRWKFVDRLQKKRFLLLTATPFQNDLIELYNLLHLLKRGHLGTIKEFRQKFLYRGNSRHPLNPLDLKKKLEEVMVRRRRDETGIDYKARVPKIVTVELSKTEKMIYDNTVRLLKENYFRADGREINALLIVFAILPKITSSSASAKESLQRIIDTETYHEITKTFAQGILDDYATVERDSKIEKLVELIEEIISRKNEDGSKSDEKILIYTRHPTTLRYIVEKLKPFNLKIIEFMGGLDREEKSRRIESFKRGEADIMISTDTGAEGLNFQFCRNLINYDLPWNPMSVEQRIGRLDRIGQNRDMYIYSFATKGTMEEHVVDLIINKMCCVGLVIGELPIILFNLGLDGEGKSGRNKIEEKLMASFIEGKGNLEFFARNVNEIAAEISLGMKDYENDKVSNKKFFDE